MDVFLRWYGWSCWKWWGTYGTGYARVFDLGPAVVVVKFGEATP